MYLSKKCNHHVRNNNVTTMNKFEEFSEVMKLSWIPRGEFSREKIVSIPLFRRGFYSYPTNPWLKGKGTETFEDCSRKNWLPLGYKIYRKWTYRHALLNLPSCRKDLGSKKIFLLFLLLLSKEWLRGQRGEIRVISSEIDLSLKYELPIVAPYIYI